MHHDVMFSKLKWLFIFVVIFVLTNLQSLSKVFAFHNDFKIYEFEPNLLFYAHPEADHLIGIGRPLGALLLEIQSLILRQFNTMDAFLYGRAAAIVLIAWTAWFFFRYILAQYPKIKAYEAFFLSFGIFLLPSMEINTFWVANFIPCVTTIPVVILAFILFRKKHYFGSTILSIGILLIYPPAFMFFGVMSFLDMIFGDYKGNNYYNIFIEIIFVISLSLIYFCFVTYIWKPFLLKSYPSYWNAYYTYANAHLHSYVLSPEYKLSAKLIQLKDLGQMSMALWFDPICNLPFKFASIVLLLTFINLAKRGQQFYLRLIIFLLIIMVLISPIVTAPPAFNVPYRTIFPISAAVFISYFSIYWYMSKTILSKISGPLFFIIFLMGIFATMQRIDTVVYNSAHEFRTVKQALSTNISKYTDCIYIRIIEANALYEGRLYRDYGLLGVGGTVPMTGLVLAALRDLNMDFNKYDQKIFFLRHAEEPEPNATTKNLIINLQQSKDIYNRFFIYISTGIENLDFEEHNTNITSILHKKKSEMFTEYENSWRWGLGPKTTIKFFSPTSKPLIMRFKASNIFNWKNRMNVYLNNKLIRSVFFNPNSVLQDEILVIPFQGKNVLTIRYTDWMNRTEDGNNRADNRKLALMFWRLQLVP